MHTIAAAIKANRLKPYRAMLGPILGLLLLNGCTTDTACTPGKQERCACRGGAVGIQQCTAEAVFGPCDCEKLEADGGSDGGPAKGDWGPASDGRPLARDGASADSAKHAPRILTLSTNSTRLTEKEKLVITTVVTDPDGIEDLIGGLLEDPHTKSSYGSFGTSAQEGSYQIVLTVADINAVRPLDTATTAQEVPRVMQVRFFDTAGHSAIKTVTVNFHCTGTQLALCDGQCVDRRLSAKHCGGCGKKCGSDWPDCGDGLCSRKETSIYARTCDAICETEGLICRTAFNQRTELFMDCAVLGSDKKECFCVADPSGCAMGAENTLAACTDGCSNDGDRFIDCDDFDCCDVLPCPKGTACFGK